MTPDIISEKKTGATLTHTALEGRLEVGGRERCVLLPLQRKNTLNKVVNTKKSPIRETLTLSACADSSTNTKNI